ncbi:DUF397 domain-containing protein [Streptomyces sp. NBC_01483]|uniref:DUF397 domain-containing protein n=1 Tax=Streptomyces sp. NBC_01483 TaxID=2903883 RepID=UPI002E3759D6|nr:DUF397 domain-containing protein [Streptomyces sp. NBC_01483]
MTSTRLEWFKSSHSSNDGPDCVEIAIAPAATVHVRDSKDTQRAQLAFTGTSWTEFVSSVRR